MPRQQESGQYRGRRRLPKLPSKRYAAVVSIAFLGAGAVALSAGTVIPESLAPSSAETTQALAVQDRLNALDRANRSQERNGAISVDQGAPDVWLLPIQSQFQISSVYAWRWGRMHNGIDMSAPYGTPIFAAHAGTVILSAVADDYGLCVKIDHGNGVVTVYGHASQLLVQMGQKVDAGQMIALVGSTGRSTGNHLHFEVRINGEYTDPMAYLLKHGVDVRKRLETATGGTVVG